MGTAVLVSQLISSSGLAADDTCGTCTGTPLIVIVSDTNGNRYVCSNACPTILDPSNLCDKTCWTYSKSDEDCEACLNPDAEAPTEGIDYPGSSKMCEKVCIKDGHNTTCSAVCLASRVSI